ncbi:hypothetical protein OKW34_003267 [Paraburkholderia youngii]|uniref:TylF/MycF/NovP-related O-methyltransferase n=1 Tax=Paraburkholderia TaxID=1822464 RepID=UPI003D1CEAA6
MSIFERFLGDPLFANLTLFEPTTQTSKSVAPETFPTKRKFIVSDQPIPQDVSDSIGPVLTNVDGLAPQEISEAVFYIGMQCDSDALPVLRRIKQHGGTFVPHLNFAKTEYRFVNRLAHNAMVKTWTEKGHAVSHLHTGIHENLCEALDITRTVEGDYVEIGVYRGGSALTAINYLDQLACVGAPCRKAWLLDTYDGFTYEEAVGSMDALWSGTHRLYGKDETMKYIRETVMSDVSSEFELIAVNICADDLPFGIKKISVANIDVDMYEATLAALHKVSPLMAQGGIIIAEDPTATPGLYGALLALDEFMTSPAGRPFYKIFKGSQYFLIRMH